jgi:hypothetical protein
MSTSMLSKKHLAKSVLWVLAGWLIAGGIIATPGSYGETPLTITTAKWDDSRSQLYVAGRGTAGATVVVLEADTLAELGSTTVKRRGNWRLRLRNLSPAPCRIQAESGEQIQDQDVSDAPLECDASEPPSVTLTGLTISGPDAVTEKTSANYSATAKFSDGSIQPVTNTADWSLQDSTYANIDGSGVLTASEVSADQVDTLIASYQYEGISKQATASVILVDVSEPVTGSHADRFTTYEGTQTCLVCHTEQAREVHDSVHYQWQGDSSETIGLVAGDAGKLGGINDFCIYPDINWIGKLTTTTGAIVDGGCAKCHVGLGAKPSTQTIQSQLENIDCLICHSDSYKRTVEKVTEGFRFVPDTEKMTVSILQAAVDVTLPSKGSCLNCHTKAGGGDNFKRGDIEEYHRDPTRSFDVHMASQAKGGAGLDCLDCHTAMDHKIAGRGSDLRPRELADQVACTNCHTPEHNEDIRKHTARVNCTVCHIPIFAKVAGTDMNRDWSRPGELVEAKGLYEPAHEKDTHVVPEYRFFNGKSYFYQFGDPVDVGENGRVVMSAPEGNIGDSAAKIYAFKHHLATQPVEPHNGRLLPLKIGKFFETGEIDEAVNLGATAVSWYENGDIVDYEFADTERYMGLFHEVAPKEQALSCNDCHNGGSRLDFVALGYTPKATYNSKPLCASCHKDETNEWPEEYFKKVHAKHVNDKKLDCSKCHNFSSAN